MRLTCMAYQVLIHTERTSQTLITPVYDRPAWLPHEVMTDNDTATSLISIGIQTHSSPAGQKIHMHMSASYLTYVLDFFGSNNVVFCCTQFVGVVCSHQTRYRVRKNDHPTLSQTTFVPQRIPHSLSLPYHTHPIPLAVPVQQPPQTVGNLTRSSYTTSREYGFCLSAAHYQCIYGVR